MDPLWHMHRGIIYHEYGHYEQRFVEVFREVAVIRTILFCKKTCPKLTDDKTSKTTLDVSISGVGFDSY